VIKGNVRVYGRGDPTFSANWQAGEVGAALQPLVFILTNAGVRTIKGDLIGDESFLAGLLHGVGWIWEDLEYAYGSPLSSLSFDGNSIKIHVTPGTHPDTRCQVTPAPTRAPLDIVNTSSPSADAPAAPVSARRLLGSNTIIVSGKLQVGAEPTMLSVPVGSPAKFFMQNLAATLDRHGIKLEGRVHIRSEREPSPTEC
jgi:D-alanyl-D-alanine carboxypeptidase/D-alanyl-D-alanine-endopeptidase (penicillin-binding protein 4)